MLVKIGSIVFNLLQISYIDLNVEQDEITIDKAVSEMFPVPGQPSPTTQKTCGVQITFLGEVTLYFWDEEADAIRWYFNHPTSDVVDIKGLKG